MKKNKISNVLIIVVTFLLGAGLMYVLKNYLPDNVQTIINRSEKEVTVNENGIADAVEKLYDAVVVVGSYKNNILSSSGTGFVYDNDDKFAYIITNSHVVEGSTSVKVKFTNDTVESVDLIAYDSFADIAVLKIDKTKILKTASIGDVKSSRVGDTVFAIGAPIKDEYSWTVSRGILSGKDRLVDASQTYGKEYIMNVLQTDTSINSGNSGGPLANANGEVIGVVNMKLVIEGVEGIGFAIPIDDAINYANQLREKGKIERPFLGISSINTSDTYTLIKYGINVDTTVPGIVIIQVQDNSSASKAGLKAGDIITKIDDKDITSVSKFKYYLYKYNPKDKIKITYIRNGKTETTTATLDKNEQ